MSRIWIVGIAAISLLLPLNGCTKNQSSASNEETTGCLDVEFDKLPISRSDFELRVKGITGYNPGEYSIKKICLFKGKEYLVLLVPTSKRNRGLGLPLISIGKDGTVKIIESE